MEDQNNRRYTLNSEPDLLLGTALPNEYDSNSNNYPFEPASLPLSQVDSVSPPPNLDRLHQSFTDAGGTAISPPPLYTGQPLLSDLTTPVADSSSNVRPDFGSKAADWSVAAPNEDSYQWNVPIGGQAISVFSSDANGRGEPNWGEARPADGAFSQGEPSLFSSAEGLNGGIPTPAAQSSNAIAVATASGVQTSSSAVQVNSSTQQTETYPGSGLVFVNTYGSSVDAAYQSAIITAENYWQSQFSNSVTLYESFSLSPLNAGDLADNDFSLDVVSYSQLVNALTENAVTADQLAAVASLPAQDPSNGAGFALAWGEATILGRLRPNYQRRFRYSQ